MASRLLKKTYLLIKAYICTLTLSTNALAITIIDDGRTYTLLEQSYGDLVVSNSSSITSDIGPPVYELRLSDASSYTFTEANIESSILFDGSSLTGGTLYGEGIEAHNSDINLDSFISAGTGGVRLYDNSRFHTENIHIYNISLDDHHSTVHLGTGNIVDVDIHNSTNIEIGNLTSQAVSLDIDASVTGNIWTVTENINVVAGSELELDTLNANSAHIYGLTNGNITQLNTSTFNARFANIENATVSAQSGEIGMLTIQGGAEVAFTDLSIDDLYISDMRAGNSLRIENSQTKLLSASNSTGIDFTGTIIDGLELYSSNFTLSDTNLSNAAYVYTFNAGSTSELTFHSGVFSAERYDFFEGYINIHGGDFDTDFDNHLGMYFGEELHVYGNNFRLIDDYLTGILSDGNTFSFYFPGFGDNYGDLYLHSVGGTATMHYSDFAFNNIHFDTVDAPEHLNLFFVGLMVLMIRRITNKPAEEFVKLNPPRRAHILVS